MLPERNQHIYQSNDGQPQMAKPQTYLRQQVIGLRLGQGKPENRGETQHLTKINALLDKSVFHVTIARIQH
jgi:hypothetical protein